MRVTICRHSSATISTAIPLFHARSGVVPVKGHCPSSKFCVTLSTVGVFRIDCSDMREKPSSSPPHPTKTKSMATNTIISLVGMLAVLERYGAVQQKRLDEVESS